MRPALSQLSDLRNVGPAALGDFAVLGISTIAQLQACKPGDLFLDLQRLTGKRQDPCVYDVFASTIHQAKTGEAKNWWAFTSERKVLQRAGAFPFGDEESSNVA
jgi:Pathogenicity locus